MVFSLYLNPKKASKRGNLSLIYLRATSENKRILVNTGIKVELKFWDADKQKVTKDHPEAYELNAHINYCLSEAARVNKQLQEKGKRISLDQFKDILTEKRIAEHDFFSFAKEILKRYLIKGEAGTYSKNLSILNKIKKFNGSEFLNFNEIDVAFCERYSSYCVTTWKNKNSTIMNSIKFIRFVINQAILEGETSTNKTQGFKRKIEESKGEYLTEDEILSLEAVPANSKLQQQVKDMFIFSAKYTGLRISDLLFLKVNSIKNEMLSIKIKKTKKTLKLWLHKDALVILKKYCQGKKPDDFVFEFKRSKELIDPNINLLIRLKAYKSVLSSYNNTIEKLVHRAGLEKHVTSHISRSSFACYWVTNIKNVYSLKNVLGHSSIRETELYTRMANQSPRDEINRLHPKSTH